MGRTAAKRQKYLFDASASALGYLYQCRYALLLALRREEDSAERVTLEKLDDVTFIEDDLGRVTPKDLLQFKHHVTRRATLTDSSVDLWNSLRIWAQAILDKKVEPSKIVFTLVSTSVAGDRSAIGLLRPAPGDRNPAEAERLLQVAGCKSRNKEVKVAHGVLMRLSARNRTELFEAVRLLDASPQIGDVRREIEREVRYAADKQHIAAFVDRLEGWWFRMVVEHFMRDDHEGIAVSDIQQQVRELREEFKREKLPDDFGNADVPDEETSPDDDRLFVHQLRLIALRQERIRTAQEDHYRAFSQRSKWINDNLMNLDELGRFEKRLIDEWKHKREILHDELDNTSPEAKKVNVGVRLYNWTQETAPGQAALLIRPLFQPQYIVRGSYHMLADTVVGERPRVGWHPDFGSRLMRQRQEEDGYA
jgi:hypothetical protein